MDTRAKQSQPPTAASSRRVAMTVLAHLTGVFLIAAGSITTLIMGYLLFYNVATPQQSAIVALLSCLCWLWAYSTYQSIQSVGLGVKPEKNNERNLPHKLFTPRNISLVMTTITGLLFGILVVVWFNLTIQFLILAPFVMFFPFTYMAYSAFQRPVRIQRLRGDFELLTAQWDEPLYQQSTSFFNYALHITLAILATLLGLFILFMPASNLIGTAIETIGLKGDVLRAMGFGFLGSYLFSMYYVYRRYTTSDLLPPVYLYCAITIILGLVFNFIGFRALDSISTTATPAGAVSNSPTGLVKGMVDLLSFAIGFFPILAVQWMTQIVYKAFGQPPRRSDLFPLDQLDGISQSQEIRLRDYGIDDAQNLASAEMPLLLINTPFPVQTVVDWVDQAVLMVLLNDKNALDNFRKAHVRTMTDFRDLWGPNVEKQLKLKRELDMPEQDKSEALGKKLEALKDEQTQIANALNSNVSLLDALYSSTNFDMNIHYLNNYRKNIELLLPGWSNARFNRYLIEAYSVKTTVPNTERKEFTRLWNFINGYLETNTQIKETQRENPHDDSLGLLVDPTSIEARLGLAWLYLHRKSECKVDSESETYQKLADAEYTEAAKQILMTISQLTKSSDVPANELEGWKAVQEAASKSVQRNVTQTSSDGSDITPVLQTTSWKANGTEETEKAS